MQSLSRYLPVTENPSEPAAPLEEKYHRLRETVRELGTVVIGFSGGADSALLTRVAYTN